MIGGLIGGATGITLGIAASGDDGSYVEIGPEEIVVAAALMGAAGAGVGALIGAASEAERWEPVILRDALSTLR